MGEVDDLLSADLGQMKKVRIMRDFFECGNQQLGVGQALVVEFNLDLQKFLGEAQRVVLHVELKRPDVLFHHAHGFKDVYEVPRDAALSVVKNHSAHVLALLVSEDLLAQVGHLFMALELKGMEVVELPHQGKDSLRGGGRKLKRARAPDRRFVQFVRFVGPRPF